MFLPKKVLKREFLMSSEAKKEPNSFVFAIIMCLVCGLLLTAAAVGLKSRQTQNVIVDQQKNILKALGLLPQKKLKNNEVQQLFNQAVSKRYMTADGNILMENQQNISIKIQFKIIDFWLQSPRSRFSISGWPL